MKILFAVSFVAALSACAVSNDDVKEADRLCKEHSGIRLIYWTTSTKVSDIVCLDGVAIKESRK